MACCIDATEPRSDRHRHGIAPVERGAIVPRPLPASAPGRPRRRPLPVFGPGSPAPL